MNLAPKIGSQRFLGLALWQYIGFALLVGLSFVVHRLLSWLLKALINFLSDSRLREYLDPKKVLRIARIGSLFLLVYLIQLLLPALLLPIELSKVVVLILQIMSLVFGVILALRLADFFMLYFSRFTSTTKSSMDDQLRPILHRVLQVLIVIGGLIQGLGLLDVNVTALIAGVSIGGLAIALAAQDTVKNLIGSVMIFVDRPFQIGDYVSGGGVVGVIEEVGFRSTRIRSADTSVISVPNGRMADMTVENFGLRTFRRFSFNVRLTYDTPTILINALIRGIRAIIESHPNTRKEGVEVHLAELSADSINVMILLYIITDSWSEALPT
ncbi:MAG: mechanosensitive ion channel domain-containing protein, partial [Bacteroidota bacterium]